jgi:hypothetical protein
MATKEKAVEAPSGKKVVTSETILEQPSESATDNYDPAKLENTASEMGHALMMDDVASTELDWSDMAPVKEFDNPNQPPQEQPQPTQEQAPQEEVPQEQPLQEAQDVDLTDSMRKRITGIKEKSTQELAEKDALIAARDDQIAKMASMVQEYTQLQESYRPDEGDTGAVQQEIAGLDTMLKEEGDALTSAEVAQHVIRRSNLERKLDKMEANKTNTNNLLRKQQVLRQQSDKYVKDAYPFVSDQKSEMYGVMKNQAYPLLEQLMGPNFKNHPSDMIMAAELSKMMVNSQKYEQLLGNTPAPRSQPAPMAGNSPRTAPQSKRPMDFKREVASNRGGDVSRFAELLHNSGHSWRPGN